ncbi:MAG: hypothetical protein ACK5Z0_01535 [Planctomycetota bacterium]
MQIDLRPCSFERLFGSFGSVPKNWNDGQSDVAYSTPLTRRRSFETGSVAGIGTQRLGLTERGDDKHVGWATLKHEHTRTHNTYQLRAVVDGRTVASGDSVQTRLPGKSGFEQ